MKWKVYEYHWMDHYHNGMWVDTDYATGAKAPMVITGVGIKIGQDKHYIYFTEGIQSDGDRFNGVMAVMRKNILYLKHIHTLDTKQYKT